mgnify:CR=1 FL=1
MMFHIAPALCMAFKGKMASDLFERYDGQGGLQRALLDMEIANEINEQISEAHSQSEKSGVGGLKRPSSQDGNAMVARRNARRLEREKQQNI